MRLTGKMVKGRRVYDDAVSLAIANREVGEGERFTEEFGREKKVRTLKQNNRYWKLLEPIARHHLNIKREQAGLPPFHKTDKRAHGVLCGAFIGMEETELGVSTYVSSAEQGTKEFSIFQDRVEAWLASLGYCMDAQAERDWAQAEAEDAA